MSSPILRTDDLTKRFGGVTAVDAVDFALHEGELCSLIGPNGAGKTTFFNLLTGTLDPTDGTVEFRREAESGWTDLTDAAPHETAAAGLHRSYQVTNVFENLSVLENVRVAAQAAGNDSLRIWRNAGHFDSYREEAARILDRVDLASETETLAGTLSHGAKRQLEIGVALAGDPDVLLLDEPAAGVSSESVEDVVALIRDVARDHAVLLVEHNMDVVMDLSDRIVVLHQGAVIADDDPAAVRDDPDVQEAYLGGYDPDETPGAAGDDADANGDDAGANGTDDEGVSA